MAGDSDTDSDDEPAGIVDAGAFSENEADELPRLKALLAEESSPTFLLTRFNWLTPPF